MMKLLLGRLLPLGLTIGLMTSALSPLRPALKAFAVAANALAGNGDAGGAQGLGEGLGKGVLPGADAPSSGDTDANDGSRRKLLDLASSLRGDAPVLKTYGTAPAPKRPKTRRRAPRVPRRDARTRPEPPALPRAQAPRGVTSDASGSLAPDYLVRHEPPHAACPGRSPRPP